MWFVSQTSWMITVIFISIFWEATWALPCTIAQTCPFSRHPTSLSIFRFLSTPCVCGGRFGPRTAPGQNPQSCTYIGSPQRQDSDTFSYRLRNSFGHARTPTRTHAVEYSSPLRPACCYTLLEAPSSPCPNRNYLRPAGSGTLRACSCL